MREDLPHAGDWQCSSDTGGGGETGSFPVQRSSSEILLAITDLVLRLRSLPDLLKDLAPLVQNLTGCDLVNFSLYDSRQNCMLTDYWIRNQGNGQLDAFGVDESIAGWVWKRQEPISIPDLNREDRFPACVQAVRQLGVRSYCMLPMSTSLHHFGGLGLGKNIPDVVAPPGMQLLSRIAMIVALGLENRENHRALQEQQERLTSLVAIGQELSSSLDLERLAPLIFANLRRITHYDYAVLALLEADNQSLRIHAVDPLPGSRLMLSEGRTVALEEAISAEALATRTITFLSEEDLDRFDTKLAAEIRQAGVHSICCVPLFYGSQPLGTLNCGSQRKNAFRPQEAEYLRNVASQIASSIHNANAYRETAQLKDRLAQEKRYLENEIRSELRFDDTIGDSGALKRVLDHAAIVANTDSTVLITGETGTGKERVARSIHSMSRRKDRNFIKLNCAAIPTGLLESELFGHEKGAFTGAVSQKVGRLELADKGTLFLDEVGEIPLEVQPKLLRVLQDQEFERLGGTRTIRVDVRLIAATNRDLLREVEAKQFRSDLYYRLHVFPLHLPPLRERREDIPLLVRYFVEKSSARLNKHIAFIPDEAIGAMLKWQWPGNIRELENFIERSVILSEGNSLRPPLSELRLEISGQQAGDDGTLRQKERAHIIEVLRQTRGVLSGPSGAAARLGLKRTTLQSKLQKLGISRMDYFD
jgi:formate hydrogenlyase transcriptional activator